MAIAVGREFLYTEGSSRKYWRVFQCEHVVATHYGRIGSKGSITVHHFSSPRAATAKADSLISSKRAKGYYATNAAEFAFPADILDAAASTNGTGNGGNNPNLTWALVAFYHAAAINESRGEDPMAAYVRTPADAEKVALGALSGTAPSDALLNEDIDVLRVMAGLSGSGPVPAFGSDR